MPFKKLAEFLQKIENTAGRNEITVMISEFFPELKPLEAKYAMYFIQGRLAPKFVDLEFAFSQKMVVRSLEELYGDEVRTLYGKLGDTGLLAQELKENKKLLVENGFKFEERKIENIEEVYKELTELALVEGKGSQEQKISKYKDLILNLDSLSAKYVTRVIVGELRLGISDKTILDSISWFIAGDKSLRKTVDRAFGARADVGELVELVIGNKEKAVDNLAEIKIKPGVPVASKLVEREIDAKSVWERMPNTFVQPKLDGLRGQIHFDKSPKFDEATKSVITEDKKHLAEIYSRNMETLTDQFPEITKAASELGVDSIILDSEIIGFDVKKNNYMSYQDTMKRRRKFDIDTYAKDIPVKAMCFDILYLNGKDLTNVPIEERLKLLKDILGDKGDVLEMLETKQMQSEEELQEYFESKVYKGLEGIIAKQPTTDYDPGTRNFKWIKLKANSLTELVDTIDIAVLGYYYGSGGRAQHGFGAVLGGVYDAEEDKYYSIGKIGSGFKDDDFPKMIADMNALKVTEMPENYVVDKTLIPDAWVKPGIVSEIVADEITRSPNHTAARGIKAEVKNDDSEKGLSIRFPRIKIWKRDKDLPNSVKEIVRMYELRKGSK